MSIHISQNRANKVITRTAGLPIIKCSCGYKILLLPSVKAMNLAIEAHVETHVLKIKDAAEAERESEQVRSNLIEQVFELASKL